ncbi:MAG: hypothetical protein ACRDH2_09160, partial [Anaerolineales bacterium]
NALVALVLGVSLLENGLAFAAQNPLGYLAGAQSAADYRKANLGWYAVAIERVNALPAGSRVTFLWEARSLECAAPDRCAPDAIIDRWWLLRRTVGTASAAIARWKAQGMTHALIYDLGANFVRDDPTNAFIEADWAELEALRGQMRLIENVGGVYSLYELP